MRGVYIHIPFCNKICSYCDFPKQVYNKDFAKNYLESLSKEIETHYEEDTVKSIYIGGGTPSVLDMEGLTKLFKIIDKFNRTFEAEITFEMNVDDVTEEKILFLKSKGVNRISVGIQSFNKKNQEFLGRKHSKKEIFERITLIKRIGIENINVDLMYALPNQSVFSLKQDLKQYLKLGVDHISTYSLIIEPHTRIYVEGVTNINEELDAKMYEVICKVLSKNGFNHYEVSNFARNKKESEHNLIYWNNEEYYGFGLGAHGFINDLRYENTKNYTEYISGNYRVEEMFLSTRDDMENEVMLGLRKLEGINIKKFYEKYGKNIQDEFELKSVVKDGLLVLEGEYLKIPENKIYIMNEILNRIIK